MGKGANAKPRQASGAPIATPANTRRSTRKPAATARLVLDAECTLRDAARLKSLLLSAVPGKDGTILDGSAVERIDTAALQLLAAFARGETAAGRRIAWAAASAELQSASARLGLLEALALPARAGAA